MGYEKNRLWPLKGRDRPQRFGTYDIEATGWRSFLMAGVYDGSKYFFTLSGSDLVEHMLKPEYSGYIWYAHYGGGYDTRFILDYIAKNRQDLEYTIIETHGLIMCLDVQTPGGHKRWRFYDSWQLIKGSLDELTTVFDVKHKKLTGTVDRENLTDTTETREYLHNDVLGLYEVLEHFYSLDLVKGSGHKMTTSSLAMSIFRQKYLGGTVLYKLTPDKELFVRESYAGGRNEIFKMTGENVTEYDVNSMYVSAMREPLPCGSKGTWATSYDFNDPRIVGFCQAWVRCPANLHIPLLPIRHQGKLIFPRGTFKGIWFSAELKKAMELGYKVHVEQALIFPARRFLKRYAEDCWQIRQDNPGKNPLNMTAKLLGNGLYGKFAQQRERSLIVKCTDFEAAAEAGWTLVSPEYDLWRQPTYSDSPAILPHISAAITSYSRLILYRYLEVYPEQVLYCDTDSVFLEGGLSLPAGSGLGEMKEEAHYSRFIAIQPKFYLCEKEGGGVKCRAKGFTFERDPESGKDRVPWQYADFLRALSTGDYYQFAMQGREKMSKLNEALNHADLLYLVARSRSVRSPYSKRIVNLDLTTTPLDMDEIKAQQEIFEDQEEKRSYERALRSWQRAFRRTVISLGGVRASGDYESIPRWARRRQGQALDTMATELTSMGYRVDGAEDLYKLLWEV